MSRLLTIALLGGGAFVLFRIANLTRDREVTDAGGDGAAVQNSIFSPQPIEPTAEGVDFADFFDPPASSSGGTAPAAGGAPAPAPAPQPETDFSDVGL